MKLQVNKDLLKKGDKGILYLLELHLEDKVLVKIGITLRSKVEDRVLEILLAIHKKYRYYPHCKQLRFRTVDDPLGKESRLHEYFRSCNYTTEHSFGGSTELFEVDSSVVKDAYDKLLAGELDGRYEDSLGCADGADAEERSD